MIDKESCIRVAACVKPHGVNGTVIVRTETGFTVDSVSYDFLFLEIDGGLVPFYVDEIREKGNDEAFITFEDVDTQEKARLLSNVPVFVMRNWLSDDEDGDIAIGSLVGFDAFDSQKGHLGKIIRIEDIVNNPLFVISHQKQELLIPIVDDFIDSIDDEQRKVVFRLPDGLLDL